MSERDKTSMGRKVMPLSHTPGSRKTGHSKGKHLNPLDNETSRALESDYVPNSCQIEGEIQRVVRKELEPIKSDVKEVRKRLEHLISHLADLLRSRIPDTVKGKNVQPICSTVKDDDTIQEEGREELEHSSSQSVQAVRSSGKRRKMDEVRNWKLRFKKEPPSGVSTEEKLTIDVELVHAKTGEIVQLGPESPVEVEVLVLEGDCEAVGYDGSMREGFGKSVVRPREGKGPLLIGNLKVNLNGGTGVLDNVRFTDNSKWTRSGKFRLALRASPKYRENICEAISGLISVKANRGQAQEKHYPPAPGAEVWRLKNIRCKGPFHVNLEKKGIHNVEQFLHLHKTDQGKLREILKNMTKKNWEDLIEHAKTCSPNENHPENNESDSDRQLIDHTAERVRRAADKFSPKQENHEDTIGKASSSFASQFYERQTENPAPDQRNMAPSTCAAPVGPEAPPANAGSTAEGHDGVTVLPLPVQSEITYFGNPTEFPANEIARLASHQPTSANNWNGLISPGDSGITADELPTQSHNINLQYAMRSQMTDPSRQIDSTVNEHGLPSGPTCASTSSFRNVLSPGHNSVITFPLPVESQNTYFGNPTEFPTNEIARPASHQPTSANNWNGLISPGDNGITSGKLPTQSPDINIEFAMRSQMIDPSRQMDSAVNEHVLPSGPTCASISIFRNGHYGVTTLPLPVQSQNAYFGYPAEVPANEIARPASHQHTSANDWNCQFSPGDNDITINGLPTQSPDIQFAMHSQMVDSQSQTINEHDGPISASISSFQNGHNGLAPLASHQRTSANNWNGVISPRDNGVTTSESSTQYAMPSQMFDSWSQRDSTVSQHVLPSGSTCASKSSFQSSSTLPVPGGNAVMEGIELIFSHGEIEEVMDILRSHNPPDVDTSFQTPPLG